MANYGFIKLCYGVVGKMRDTSKMTVDEVIQAFLALNDVKSEAEYYDKTDSHNYGKA